MPASPLKRPLILLCLFMAALLTVLIIGVGLTLVEQAYGLHPIVGWLVGLALAGLLLVVLSTTVMLLFLASTRLGLPLEGSRRHRQYLHYLSARHRRHTTFNLDGLPPGDKEFLEAIHRHLEAESTTLMTSTAETIFFHTAVSQSGHLDRLVVLGNQLKLIWRLTQLYHPRPRLRTILSLYTHVTRAVLHPSARGEVDLGAQIGPAIVGASVVGAIPGANLVSLIIADAVIQGSANALATLRAGLLTRRYFQGRLEGQPLEPGSERQAVNPQALEMLSRLVSSASGVLSREIWDAAKDNLRRMPAATYDSLKSLVSKSVRGLGRKKAAASDDDESDQKESTTETR
ncbi:MAG: DUF697 domain-containing protein [Fidelibacterota bacterium]|nr:MAG: DUF697 domain-containing protein [Candidatus Neomarinimicrobiota bacterium]